MQQRHLGRSEVPMQSDVRSDVPGMVMVAHVEVAGAQVDSFVAMDKEYSGVLRLGQTTPSMDSETEPDLERPWQHLDDAQLAAAAVALEGDILQLPPMYSAIKIKGAPPGRLRSALAAHVRRAFWLACYTLRADCEAQGHRQASPCLTPQHCPCHSTKPAMISAISPSAHVQWPNAHACKQLNDVAAGDTLRSGCETG